MASLRARLVRSATSSYLKSIDARTADVPAMRRRWHALARVLPVARRVARTREQVAGLTAERFTPRAAADNKILLYFHGGAYLMGSCATHRQFVSHIARAAGICALLPEYRLAPEHPFPAAIDDAVSVYRLLLDQGYEPGDIVIAGDSAGGGLTMATLLSLREAGIPLPAAACLISPWLDLAGTGDSMRTHAHRDPWFRPENLPTITSYYCDPAELRNPLVSPVYADLGGLPPLFIQVGEDEILLSDSTRAADSVRAAGGQVELEIFPGMWHVFQIFVHQVPESRDAIRKIGDYMRRVLRCARVAR